MRDEAEELQRSAAGVSELVDFVWSDVNRNARRKPMLAPAIQDGALAFQDEDLVLVAVGVFGRVAAGGHFELPHGKAGGTVVRADQASHAAAIGSLHLDDIVGNLLEMCDFHGRDRLAG